MDVHLDTSCNGNALQGRKCSLAAASSVEEEVQDFGLDLEVYQSHSAPEHLAGRSLL